MLVYILLQLVVVVAVLTLVGIFAFIGRYRLRVTLDEWPGRLVEAVPVASILVFILLMNRHYRQEAPELERRIGVHATEYIEALEGEWILVFQDTFQWLSSVLGVDAIGAGNLYFSFMYVYGYVFLLVFPVVAYFALPNTRPLRELLVAYTVNYGLGLVFYTLVIAFGPRNSFPHLVEATMLYDSYPSAQVLTREVNRNTNVFPSLHTSLAATVAMFAYLTRDIYRRWFPVAGLLALSVAISTMYLAIHWAVDVVAGIALAALSVVVARIVVGRYAPSVRLIGWVRTRLGRV